MSCRAVALLAILLARQLAAQQADCHPGNASNEAKTMAVFAVPLAFASAVAPAVSRPWSWGAGMELVYLPKVDSAIGVPTICRSDKTKPENTDLLFALPRPRIWLSLPAGLLLEASWIPPVRIAEAKANLVGFALSHSNALGSRGAVLELRAHATLGVVNGPITCDDTALADATSPCYQGTRSDDAFHPNVIGVAAAMGWRLGALRPYLGAGYNHLAPRFRVHFTNRFGDSDRRRVIVDLERAVIFGGASWAPARRIELSGELYAAPSDAVTVRLTARVLPRR